MNPEFYLVGMQWVCVTDPPNRKRKVTVMSLISLSAPGPGDASHAILAMEATGSVSGPASEDDTGGSGRDMTGTAGDGDGSPSGGEGGGGGAGNRKKKKKPKRKAQPDRPNHNARTQAKRRRAALAAGTDAGGRECGC